MDRHEARRQEVIPANTHELDILLQGYHICARTEAKSPKTIKLTSSVVMLFRDFLVAHGLSCDATRIGVPEIRQFIIYLQATPAYSSHPHTRARTRPLAGHTVNTYLRMLRAFWSWLVREGVIPRNPFFDLRLPKAPHKVIPTFSEDQLRNLIKAINVRTPDGFRDRAMIILMLDTGIRLSELLHLKIEDVDLDQGMLKVYGKGAKERMIPIGDRTQETIWRYIRDYRPKPAMARYDNVFLRRTGTPLDSSRVQVLVRQYGKAIGIHGVRCSPHTFRHTFAITYLRNGGDVFSLQAILGHSGLEIVKHYVNLARTDIKAAHRKFSPADNMCLI